MTAVMIVGMQAGQIVALTASLLTLAIACGGFLVANREIRALNKRVDKRLSAAIDRIDQLVTALVRAGIAVPDDPAVTPSPPDPAQ